MSRTSSAPRRPRASRESQHARSSRRRRPVPRDRRLVNSVADRIRELRAARGLSQAELGKGYLTRAGVSSLERGVTAPSLHMLAFLAKRLGVKARDLLPPR